MNDDTISRNAVIDAVHAATYEFICGVEDGDEMTEADKLMLSINKSICTAVKELPSVQPQRMKGKWEVTPLYIKCSECGECYLLMPQNFCPNCGSDMRGTE